MKELTQVYCGDFKTSLKQVSTRACASQDRSPIPTQYGTDQLCGGIFQKHATRDPVDIFPAPWPSLSLSLSAFCSLRLSVMRTTRSLAES